MTGEHRIKSKKIEMAIIAIIVMLLLLYFYPRIISAQDSKNNKRITATCRAFSEMVLKETDGFKPTKTLKKPDLEIISKNVQKEFATSAKIGEEKCPLCIQVKFDLKTNTLIVTGYDKTLEVVTRTVINPPSFVRYER